MSAKVSDINSQVRSRIENEFSTISQNNAEKISNLKKGDYELFINISQEYLNQIYKYIFYQVKDQLTAEDLTLEIFLDAYKKVKNYPEKISLNLWFYQVAYQYMLEDPRFVSTLPFIEKQVILFKFVQGLTNQEISEITRLNQSMIRKIQARALILLTRKEQSGKVKIEKELPEILDDCFLRISAGESVVRCLFKYARYKSILEPLLKIGLSIQERALTQINEEYRKSFAENLKQRILRLPHGSVQVKSAEPVLKELKERQEKKTGKEKSGESPGIVRKIRSLFTRRSENLLPAGKEPQTGEQAAVKENFYGRMFQTFRHSKIMIIATVAMLVAVIGGALILSGALRTLTSAPSSSQSVCTLSITAGSTQVQMPGEKNWQVASNNTPLVEGNRLRTAASSRSIIKFVDGSRLIMDSETDVELKQATFSEKGQTRVLIKQNIGTTTSQVIKLNAADSAYEIQTPAALISVRGTQFITRVEADGTTLIRVSEGTVAVNSGGKEVLVKAGYEITIKPGELPGDPVQTATESSGKTVSPTPGQSPQSKRTFKLSVKCTKGGTISAPQQSESLFDEGTVVDLVAVPDPGYTFTGWSGDVENVADVQSASTTITLKADSAVTANFVQTYTLTIRSKGGSIIKPGESTHDYPAGSVVEVSAKPDAGYQFVNWTGDIANLADPKSATTTITIKNNCTITANFVRICKLKVNSASGGWVIKPGEGEFTYPEGTTLDVQAVPDSGYVFSGWTCDSNVLSDPSAAITKITMVKDTVLTPKFTKTYKIYTLTIKAGSGGSVQQPGEDTFTCKEGTVVDLEAVPDEGYGFLNWTGDIATIASPNSAVTAITMKGNYTITANFVRTYTLTVNTSTGGTVIQPGGVKYVYNAGSVVPLNAIASPGYIFTGWTGDGVNNIANPVSASTTITITGNVSITANFAKLYTLSVIASPYGIVSLSPQGVGGSNKYKEGTSVTVTAIANAGYHFVNWIIENGNVADPYAPSTTLVVTGDLNISAIFAPNEYVLTIKYAGNGTGTVEVSPLKTTYHYGDKVTLVPVPDSGSFFAGFSPQIVDNMITIRENTIITATFNTQ